MILAVAAALVFLSVTPLFQSCSNNGEISSSVESKKDSSSLSWNEQLSLSIHKGRSLIKSSSITKKANLELISYRVLKSITNSSDVANVKTEILASTSVFPYLVLENNKLSLLTISEISQQKEYKGVNYSISGVSKFLDENINIGLKEIELTWECDSKKYTSICLVSEEKGIIYDNIISNLLNVNTFTNVENKKVVSKAKRFKVNGESDYSGTYTWTTGATANWLWGSERGECTITQVITMSGGNVVSFDQSAYDYMSIGNSKSEAKTIEFTAGPQGYSKIAYGYAMTTPLMSISLTFTGSAYSVSVSGFIGSECHNSGTHTLSYQ